jgi:hypothetical protein
MVSISWQTRSFRTMTKSDLTSARRRLTQEGSFGCQLRRACTTWYAAPLTLDRVSAAPNDGSVSLHWSVFSLHWPDFAFHFRFTTLVFRFIFVSPPWFFVSLTWFCVAAASYFVSLPWLFVSLLRFFVASPRFCVAIVKRPPPPCNATKNATKRKIDHAWRDRMG